MTDHEPRSAASAVEWSENPTRAAYLTHLATAHGYDFTTVSPSLDALRAMHDDEPCTLHLDALPPGATVDDDPEAFAVELMTAYDEALHRNSGRWATALRRGAMQRTERGASFRLTEDELATAAARFGIVADRDALPLNAASAASMDAIQTGRIPGDTRHPGNDLGRYARLAEVIARQRSTGDVWAAVEAARGTHQLAGIPGGGKTTHSARYYEDSDRFDERQQTDPRLRGSRPLWPILRAAALTALAILATACATPRISAHETGLAITTTNTDEAGTECTTAGWLSFDAQAPSVTQVCIPTNPTDPALTAALAVAFDHGADEARPIPADALASAQADDPTISAIVEYTSPECPSFADESCYVIVRDDGSTEVGP
jgi:hypothetical protein